MTSSASLTRSAERLSPERLEQRLLEAWERTGDDCLHRLAKRKHPHAEHALTDAQEFSDWVSTCLMSAFKNTADSYVFSLLYELNEETFLHAVQSKLRRSGSHVDAHDVLQEVFLNIFRYPHRFNSDHADAFRNWGHRIARNTLLKALRGQGRMARCASLDDENMLEQEDSHGRAPDRSASEAESAHLVDQAYLLYLNLYLMHFERLTPKEQHALVRVEVEGVAYKDVADELGIRLENLKMVIFRGRRKILRGMTRSLSDFGSEPVPAVVDRELTRATARPTTPAVVLHPPAASLPPRRALDRRSVTETALPPAFGSAIPSEN